MPPRRRGYNESFGVDLDALDRIEEQHEALTGGVRRTQLIREMGGARETLNKEVSGKEDKSPRTFRYLGML